VVGWVGTGRMGRPLAGFILAAGYPLVVTSRGEASRRRLVEQGAREAANAADCAQEAQVVFTSLPDDAVVRAVLLGSGGVLERAGEGTILAETSTISTQLSGELAREAERQGVEYLRMPISGNAASAERGEVTALVSGPEPAWSAVRPIVETFSTAQVYLGADEQARVMKLVVNAVVVNTAQSMAEALTLGRKAGLDWVTMLDTLAESTIASPWLKAKALLLRERDFTPTMTTTLILKDMDLVLAAAREHGVPMPLAASTRQLLQVLVGEGYADEDYLSSVKLTERQAGLPADTAR
jgi:3-hydroxyisobutyrate dehydrogenase-like beta-hydroxyacid dehydrogenase